MQKKIVLVGGDQRNAEVAELFAAENHKVFVYGFEKYNFIHKNITKCDNLQTEADFIISGIPFSKDGIYINSNFSREAIKIEELFNKAQNKKIIAGGIKKEIYEIAKKYNCELIDILNNEELTILNVIPTAEGAIQIAMEESQETINGSKCLVMGFGRIGKVLSKMLAGIGAKVYCEARKKEDLAYIEAYGYEKIELNDLDKFLPEFKYIFNTIPSLILDRERLKFINKDTIIIDLASNPGGVDFDVAKEKGIKAILALGLPGKVAPRTAARYIKEVLKNIGGI